MGIQRSLYSLIFFKFIYFMYSDALFHVHQKTESGSITDGCEEQSVFLTTPAPIAWFLVTTC